MEKDSEIYRGKKEKVKSISLKAKKESSDDETSTSRSDDEEYAMTCWCNAVRGRKPSLEYFKRFGSKFFILNTKDYLSNFDPKSYDDVFLRYSQNSKKHTMKVEESPNVTFDKSPHPTKLSPLVDDDVGEEEAIKNNTKVVNNNNEEDESIEVEEIVNIKESKNHPLDQVIVLGLQI
ncbi:hypothetical protein Tco_0134351 [Tanacetum coccineum]